MHPLSARDLIALFQAIDAAIDADKDRLSQLDGIIGDADHGVTMNIGFTAVTRALAQLDPDASDPAVVFNTAAKSFLNAVGASSGPLYATAFMRVGATVKGQTALDRDAFVGAVVAMAKGIEDRGKAAPGEKTMMDAWGPAAAAAETERARDRPLAECLDAAARAATEGAESTKSMLAAKGRASRLGERVLGHVDPGAASAAVILQTLAKAVRDRRP